MNIGKRVKLQGAKVVGVGTYCPPTRVDNDFFLDRFTPEDVSNIERMSGVKYRHWVTTESASDLCIAAAVPVLEELGWPRGSIDAVIFVTQSPDYVLPASAIRIAESLGLSDGIIAFDINLGCSGYPYGLHMAMSLIATGTAERVLLLAGETASKIIDKHDRSTAMIFGDCGTATCIEASAAAEASFILGTDHKGVRNLIVPESRFACNPVADDPRLVGKDPHFIFMDGGEVFNFTLTRVPPLVREAQLLSSSAIDYFLFHQANSFMLNHLVKKMKLDKDRVPSNIGQYGNTSSASIPLLITTELAQKIQGQSSTTQLGLFGFGVGYSWSSCVLSLDADTTIIHSMATNV